MRVIVLALLRSCRNNQRFVKGSYAAPSSLLPTGRGRGLSTAGAQPVSGRQISGTFGLISEPSRHSSMGDNAPADSL